MAAIPVYRGNTHRTLAELRAWTRQRVEVALEPNLRIIDTHHHLWDDDRRGRYLLAELMEDIGTGHCIAATVFMEVGAMYRASGPVPERPLGEAEFANGVAAMSASGRYGSTRACAAIVGHADLTLGSKAQPVLEALVAAGNGRLHGIRHGALWDEGNAAQASRRQVPRHLMLSAEFQRGLACVRTMGLTFDASLFYPQLPDLVAVLRALPDLAVIVDHCGGLLGVAPHDRREEVFILWREHIRALAQFPNLNIKIGGLGMPRCGWNFHVRENPPASQELADAWRPYVETCIEAFGPQRCMMESNFPVDKQSCGYGVLWNAMKRITSGLSAAEKAMLYHDTAARVYRLAH